MRRPAVVVAALLLLTGCSSSPQEAGEFAGDGRISGSFHLGHRELRHGWVEMIELTGPVDERCGPGACGLAVYALNGEPWRPGRWQVIAPDIEGWEAPAPFIITVRVGQLTTFEASYQRQ